jgi:hypothetical protein
MRKVATAFAALAGLAAGAALACEDKADTSAEQQTQKKPVVAEKAQKPNKAKKKVVDQKTAVAKVDKG